jgi:transcriptional regulator with XRE-family HTH domain
MQEFAKRLRQRARELGLSDAEVARRAGLTERRYGHYATGTREPNLATLLRICEVLAVTPNEMLLPKPKGARLSQRERATARLSAAANNLPVEDLEIAACQLECVLKYRMAGAR